MKMDEDGQGCSVQEPCDGKLQVESRRGRGLECTGAMRMGSCRLKAEGSASLERTAELGMVAQAVDTALRRLRHEGWEFWASLDHIARLCSREKGMNRG